MIALTGGVLVCAIADLVVVNGISGSIDHRLESELSLLVHEPSSRVHAQTTSRSAVSTDPDDVPILIWFIPRGSTRPLRLNADTPKLSSSDFRVDSLVGVRLGGRAIRLEGSNSKLGRFIVGMSTAQIGSVLSTLLVIQGVLAPLALFGLFAAATLIARRAAAPIDQARLRQLEFTADASHELRTPLSVIEAEVSLALGAPRTAREYRGTLERVASESKRLRRIVQDLLWLARLDALPSGPRHDPTDVAAVAEDCAERFRALAGERGITLSLDERASPVPLIVAPVEWVDQLLAVLLDNACRYANDEGRVEIRVGATDDLVTLHVDDDGPGFDSRDRDAVLQRFHRTSDVPGGAGLGLAIAQAVVTATDGRITLGVASLGGASVKVSWPRFRGKPEGASTHEARHHGAVLQ
ncbi:MAG: sensor histidine kinase [Acidimicrobiales bacterium]